MLKKVLLANALAVCLAVSAYAQQFVDPCQNGIKVSTPISQSTPTTLFNGASGRKNYICSLSIVSPDAEKVSVIEGTGNVCATSPLALVGAVTAASGMTLGTNSIVSIGNGAAFIAAGANQNFNVCLLQTGSGTIGGAVTYTQQ